MSTRTPDRRRAIRVQQSRARRGEQIAAAFFGGHKEAFGWAPVTAPVVDQGSSLTRSRRRWLVSWESIREVGELLSGVGPVVVTFASEPSVGGLVVEGALIAPKLQQWIRQDGDLIRLVGADGLWDVSLDVYNSEAPLVALVVRGDDVLGLADERPGTEPWRWDFLPEELNDALIDIVRLFQQAGLSPSTVEVTCERLRPWGIREVAVGQGGELRFTVSATRDAQRSFDSFKRALLLEFPRLHVVRIEQSS